MEKEGFDKSDEKSIEEPVQRNDIRVKEVWNNNKFILNYKSLCLSVSKSHHFVSSPNSLIGCQN